jgi:DNA repair protein RecN (Recombination protein N)
MRSSVKRKPAEPPVLTHLALQDLVLITKVALDVGPGLTVLTGETGAGKSILLDGLGLILGDRADTGLVRAGASQATATASFLPPAGHPAFALLLENGIAADGDILIRRTVRADGGSRAFVNDTPVSATLLKSLGALLVEVHGQHDDRGLLAPRGHLALLDAFAGLSTAGVAAASQALAAAETALAEAEAARTRASQDRDFLTHALAELEALAPAPGEEADLADTRRRLQEGARLRDALDEIDTLVSASDGALSKLRTAARRMERLGDTLLTDAIAATDRMLTEGDTLEAALAAVRRHYPTDSQALEATEARLFDLRGAARKHRIPADDLATLTTDFRTRLQALDTADTTIATLTREVATARQSLAEEAARLSAARAAAAARLDTAVAAELPALKLEAARFRTRIDAVPPGPTGADRVEFEVSTNPGTPFGPLTRIASGGETSRFILALKVALAATGTAGTLIFDEVDRGVGGSTASAIGTRLATVAKEAQVLAVTHSPQVAACGQTHFQVQKTDGETRIAPLSGEARTEELARMLSGTNITPEARAQAARLLSR